MESVVGDGVERPSAAPITWGWQRSDQGSCTLLSPCAVALADGACRVEVEQDLGDADLARLAAQVLDTRIEGRVGAFQRIDRERARHQRRIEDAPIEAEPCERQSGRDLRCR